MFLWERTFYRSLVVGRSGQKAFAKWLVLLLLRVGLSLQRVVLLSKPEIVTVALRAFCYTTLYRAPPFFSVSSLLQQLLLQICFTWTLFSSSHNWPMFYDDEAGDILSCFSVNKIITCKRVSVLCIFCGTLVGSWTLQNSFHKASHSCLCGGEFVLCNHRSLDLFT